MWRRGSRLHPACGSEGPAAPSASVITPGTPAWRSRVNSAWCRGQAKFTEPGGHFQDAQRLAASEDQYMRRFHSHNNSFYVGHTCHRRHVAEQLA